MSRPIVHHLQNSVLSAAQLCNNASEAIELFEERGLYLKPIAKLNISVTLPQLKTPGKSLSNWEVMEKLKRMAQPDQFLVLRVSKSSLEFLRFEAEVEAKSLIKTLINRMDGKSIKLSGFTDTLKVRSAEARIPFPVRHDWDSFFRDAKGMNEANPGERPDCIHLENLPCRWFATKSEPEVPSENIIRRVFQTFGDLRQVDVPMLDPYRHENQITGGNFRTFNPFSNQLTFEAYVQFKEYIGFVKAMDSLKGMKLMRKTEDDKAYTAEIKIDFDKTKHLCAKSIRKREKERQRLKDLEKQREEAKRLEREEEERRIENERIKKEKEENHRRKRKLEKLTRRKMRQLEREEKRRLKREEKKRVQHEQELQRKILMEERKLVLAQRRLESIRLLTELLERAKIIQQQKEVQKKLVELEDERLRQLEDEKQRKEEAEKKKKREEDRRLREMARREAKLKEKLTQNLEKREEKRKEVEREELRQQLATRPKRLKSAVVVTTTTKKISGELTPPENSSPVEVFNKKTGKWTSIFNYSGIHF